MPPQVFRFDQPNIETLLGSVEKGALQLPDFQRGWVWDDDHIRSLIASVSLSYPIGAVMVLKTAGGDYRLKARPVEGVPNAVSLSPEALILDGQQRITSLFLALKSGAAVPTRTENGRDIKRWYYLDMAKCLDANADRLDAIVSVPEDKVVRTNFDRDVVLDVSTLEKEWEHGLLPARLLVDARGLGDWRIGFSNHHRYDPLKSQFYNRFEEEIVRSFQVYQVPVIELQPHTPKAAVCQVFEKVNTGGVALSVFELVTASFAIDDFRLRDDWAERQKGLSQYKVLKGLEPTDFLTAVTLVASWRRRSTGRSAAVSCKRQDVLALELDEYCQEADLVVDGLRRCAVFLARQRIYDDRMLPYRTQLIPLAGILGVLGGRADELPVGERIAAWLWNGIVGELYGAANESRYAADLPDVLAWVDGGEQPKTVRDATFTPMRLLSLQTRNSAAYKGIIGLLLQAGGRDFLTGNEMSVDFYFDEAVDIHHIFPKAYCETQGIKSTLWNSVVNKSPMTARTNRMLGGRAPSRYIETLESRNVQRPQLREIMRSHLVDLTHLELDRFDTYFPARASALLDRIERATQKAIAGRDAEDVVAVFGGPLTVALS